MVDTGAGVSRMSASISPSLRAASFDDCNQLAVPRMRCREKRRETQQALWRYAARHARFRHGTHQNCCRLAAVLQACQHGRIPSLRRVRYLPCRYQSSGAQYKKEDLFIDASFPG